MGEDLTFQKYGGDGLPGLMPNGVTEDAGEQAYWDSSYKEQGGAEMEGEWQDKAEFERQQEVVQGEIGKRDTAVDGGLVEEGGVVPRVKATWGFEDKEAKRNAKRERRKTLQEAARKQREKEAARKQREKDAERG